MSEFDKSKDVCLYEPDEYAWVDKFTRLSIAIFQYDGGKLKLQINREKMQKGGEWVFSKLGRMSFEEFAAVARSAKEAFTEVNQGLQKQEDEAPKGWR